MPDTLIPAGNPTVVDATEEALRIIVLREKEKHAPNPR